VWVEVHLLIADEVSVASAHMAATEVEEQLRAVLPIRMFITTHIEPVEHEAAHPGGDREAPDALAGAGR
jgi:divalent metal cation (Fe/Co/Zn/Cd) transporter